ncbi:iron complex outermembrane receptor protein [Rhizomicrobium palustre]|uniref:Iron complex outermembrane receptor protein n=1 Tax=Rhizomicrobium palustre TaxID=189966 RepID=A0A846N2G5_9PROT|nr:TonB-dependent receptor [Rhizomicrobium palustre]NIK89699.1 iron complex outermembrane receptor protein [Rhizomicrobium palustre]
MKVTTKLFGSVCPVAILALPFAFSLTPAFAQSTGTQDVETVTVTGTRMNLNGLMNAAPVAKEKSVITSDFLKTQTAGQTIFQALNFMPGVNFTNNDPYGTSGGSIRMHGQDGNHISLTLDGMPLNDTGNYAIYTNQMLDSEVVDRISALQGATDVDSPTAAATGGVIAITSDKPHDEFGGEAVVSFGEFNSQRYFGRIDTGAFGPFGTTAFGSFSYQSNDKFKGAGYLKKIQGNLKIYQDMGDLGWFSLAGHWNVNRNNNIYSPYYTPDTTGFDPKVASQIEVIKNPNGGGYIANPLFANSSSSYSADGWDRDYTNQCVYNRVQTPAQIANKNAPADNTSPAAAPKAGVADYTMTTCGNYYKTRINPSDTGNIRFSSLWRLLPGLTATLDANFQYTLATGGTTTNNLSETDSKLIGTTVKAATPATTTTPFGCIAGVGCDLNGDGDVKDTVEVQSPSVTNTRRYGLSSSLIYRLTDTQTFQVAYTLDWGLHRQTGRNGLINGLNGFYNPFGPVANDGAQAVISADGTPVRYRDRKSYAVMNQIGFDWEGDWLDGMVQTTVGFRNPWFERRLNQYCYEQAGSSTAFCTTQTMGYYNAALNYYTVSATPGAKDTKYVGPSDGSGKTNSNFNLQSTLRYSKFLPHLGLTFAPLGKEHQFFTTYTQELAAPRTDNLYTATNSVTTDATTPFRFTAGTKPETSTTYQIGYRYLGEDLQAALILWNSQVHNRIVSSYEISTNTYFDHNVKGVNFSGFDFESNYKATEDLTLYANVGYVRARITENIAVGGGFANTLNKQLSETPKWSMSGRASYDITKWWNIGVGAKYVGRRNQTEDNNAFVPDYYTVNLDSKFDLDDVGLTNSDLRFNVDNLFNKHYFGSMSNYTCWTPGTTPTSGCTSIPYANIGNPRTFSTALTLRY